MKVIDKDGVWLQNTGQFRIPDYDRAAAEPNAPMVFYEPGEATKVRLSDFIKAQPALVEIDDPMDAPQVKTKK